MMRSVIDQISDIEKELLALTADQPPNPAQIGTFKVSRTTTVDDEIKTIVFNDGVSQFVQTYVVSGSANAPIVVDGGALKVFVSGLAGITYVVVSLGEFSLV